MAAPSPDSAAVDALARTLKQFDYYLSRCVPTANADIHGWPPDLYKLLKALGLHGVHNLLSTLLPNAELLKYEGDNAVPAADVARALAAVQDAVIKYEDEGSVLPDGHTAWLGGAHAAAAHSTVGTLVSEYRAAAIPCRGTHPRRSSRRAARGVRRQRQQWHCPRLLSRCGPKVAARALPMRPPSWAIWAP